MQDQLPFITWCEEFIIGEHSLTKKILTYLKFLNLIYISITLPYYIGFNMKITGGVLIAEVVSHFISLFCFLMVFRTPVVKDSGELTLDLNHVLINYRKNGLYLDLLSILPINLIIPFFIN